MQARQCLNLTLQTEVCLDKDVDLGLSLGQFAFQDINHGWLLVERVFEGQGRLVEVVVLKAQIIQ